MFGLQGAQAIFRLFNGPSAPSRTIEHTASLKHGQRAIDLGFLSSYTQRPYSAHSLLSSPLWKVNHKQLAARERAWLSYDKAKTLGLAHNLNRTDLATLSQKFWDLHTDPMTVLDGAGTTLLTIQYNLCAGTIIDHSEGRPDLDPLIDDLLRFRKTGQFMLTEVGHGLDVASLETTATQTFNGNFILNSPTPSASKYMPPTVPAGSPMIAVVFARLIVKGEDWGVRPFLVPLNDGKEMCSGITAKLLPYRELSTPVNHAITTFNNVRLPPSALLGPHQRFENPHMALLSSLWRIAVGAIALGSIGVPGCKIHTTIAARYSMRRTVGNGTNRVPILHFRTQQIPVLTAIAQSYVLEAYQRWAAKCFSEVGEDPRVRHGISTCFKAVAVQQAQSIAVSLSERCGAQGIQSVNMMTNMHAEMRGIAIAEGDILVLAIRLATELLLERYELPQTTNPTTLLARHEAGLIEKYRGILASAPHHRSPIVHERVLPHCQRIIEAIGHRMAFDAAATAGVSPGLLDLYVCSITQLDPAWYVENMGLSVNRQAEIQSQALDVVLPQVEALVQGLGVDKYVSAPIVSDKAWDSFVDGLELFEGRGHVPLEGYGQRFPRSHL
ncbi:acyl-CoA dehydrogenase NM domain-like protein [Crassisporium funariophilum]|nr:acyl-CoA dehydrogenase NM domain-like protein [Crassisporium funariophilum]